jgi:HD superfamily phosphohydrolase
MQRWEIKDPVHGYIELTPAERLILDTPQFQRLRRIKQLSAAHLTYPGAEHTRFHHSLGVMHVSGKIAQRLEDVELIDKEEHAKIRAAGLLHDIGHGPFSHLFEEVLEKRDMNHEQMSTRIIKETEIGDILESNGLNKNEISPLAIGHLDYHKPYINNIIAGQFSADVLDYLPRDSYFSGVEYGKVDIDRLVRSINVVNNTLAVKDTALYVLEEMVIARYMMFKAVYFHRSVRSAEVMLVRAMELAEEELDITGFKTVDEYIQLDDNSLIHMLNSLKDSNSSESQTSYTLTQGFLNRKLLKCAYETVIHRKDRLTTNMMLMGNIRENLEKDIASEANVDPNTVIMDVSTAPSVPYAASQQKPQDIPLYHEDWEGYKTPVSFSSLSPLGGSLVGYLDILRVYTRPEDLEHVSKATEARFGRESASTQISF